MYKRNQNYSPEELNAVQVMWIQMKEDKIRDGRVEKLLDESKAKGNHIPDPELEERLKFPWRIKAEDLNSEEQKEMKVFEEKMLKANSFGLNLENNDI